MNTRLTSAFFLSFFLAACGGNSGGNSVSLITDKMNETQATYTLKLEVPQVKGLTDEEAQKDMNDRLSKIAIAQRDQFVNEIKDLYVDPAEQQKSGLAMTYDNAVLSQSLISIVVTVSTYIAGTAHPNSVTLPFMYDVVNKKEIAFNDLFNTKEKYLERLSELTIEQLVAESKKKGTYYEAKMQMIRQGAGPKIGNFKTYSIENGSLVLTFDPYQVGPYAEGVQTVTLSRAQITDVLSNYGRKLLSETEIGV